MSQLHQALKIVAKAEDFLRNATHDLNGGFMLATANRAYYACYYCMSALLTTQNVYAKTHQGTHGKFAELFIKPGIFPTFISSYVSVLFEYRQEADYDLDAAITEDEAKNLISKATEFLELTKNYFNQLTADNQLS